MKRLSFIGIALLLCVAYTVGFDLSTAKANTTFVSIGTGGITGVYYPTGGAIAKIVNKKRKQYGIRCTVESTGGSVFNVNAIMAGDLEFGIVQSDRQYQAVNGIAEWKDKGPQKDLRALFSIHSESLTLVASVDSNIKSIVDLKGKRVNIGNPGSGQRQNSIDALAAMGIDYKRDLRAEYVKASEAPGLLQDGRIDAFFYTVGHPSGAIKEASAGKTQIRIVPINGPGIDALIKKSSYYTKTFIPIQHYPGAVNKSDVETFGVKATFVTSIRVPEKVVYAIAKEVFDHIETFKKLHPAYKGLTKAGMLKGLSAPIHPGAEIYFRESGLR